jgi:hypothetical protein
VNYLDSARNNYGGYSLDICGTNGTMVKKIGLDVWKKIDEVVISPHGDMKVIKEAAEYLKRAVNKIVFMVACFDDNLKIMDDLCRYARQLNRTHTIGVYCILPKIEGKTYSEEELERFCNWVASLDCPNPMIDLCATRRYQCQSFPRTITLTPKGNLRSCTFRRGLLNLNILNHSPKQIMKFLLSESKKTCPFIPKPLDPDIRKQYGNKVVEDLEYNPKELEEKINTLEKIA